MVKFFSQQKAYGIFKEIDEPVPGSWINVEEAKTTDLQPLTDLLNLDLNDLLDSLDSFELPRIEKEDDAVIIVLRVPENYGGDLHTQPLTVIITDDYFVTISPADSDVIEKVLKGVVKINLPQKVSFLSKILSQLAKDFTWKIQNLKAEVSFQKKVGESVGSDDIINLIQIEEVLNQYLSALVPLRNVATRITDGNYLVMKEENEDLIEDVVNNMRQSVDVCRVSIKTIQSLRDSYQIVFTNRLNKSIQYLTAFTIIMTVPTVIGSIYGMNVNLPLAENPGAFWWIMLFSAVSSGAILIWIIARRLV